MTFLNTPLFLSDAANVRPFHVPSDIILRPWRFRFSHTHARVVHTEKNDKLTRWFVSSSPNRAYVTAVLGNSAHSSIWVRSPYEQAVRVDGVERVADADVDLYHLSRPANVSRGVTSLGVLPFQPTPDPERHTCYAVGHAGSRTEAAVLRPNTKRCGGGNDGTMCFVVTRKPRSCSVSDEKPEDFFWFSIPLRCVESIARKGARNRKILKIKTFHKVVPHFCTHASSCTYSYAYSVRN